jgi:hypothetical protein
MVPQSPAPPVAAREQPPQQPAVVREQQPQPGAPAFYRARGPEPQAAHVPADILQGIPADPKGSIARLAKYLVSGTDDPFLQVKNIHDWVAENISYNFPALLSGSIPAQGAVDILKSRTAVCEGYSQLFSALCTSASIENTVIHGYSRGYGSSVLVEDTPNVDNHAWNAVRIRGDWYLVDCTWDSGFISDNKFVRGYTTSYFFLPPEGMIFSHYPHDARWQLLDTPVTVSRFVNLPYLGGGYFLEGFAPITGIQRINSAGKETLLKVPVPPGLELEAVLMSVDGRRLRTNAFAQLRAGVSEVSSTFPTAGKWILELFARKKGEDVYGSVCGIVFDAATGTPTGFPLQYTPFAVNGCYLFSPLNSPMKVGTTATFQVLLPGYKTAFVAVGGQNFPLAKSPTSDVFSAAFVVPSASDATLFATKGSPRFEGVLKYDVSQ